MRMTVLQESIQVDGEKREYRLVMPDAVRRHSLIPVVFALHGAGDTTSDMAQHTGLDRLAVEKAFLLVYLQGRHRNWPPHIPPDNPDCMAPDLKFFEATCDEMVRRYHADPKRVYVVGVSQGGAMANVLTAKCSRRIAAAVCVCGWLPEPLGREPLNTQHKCPMLFIIGSQDRQVHPAIVRSAHDAFARDGHPVEFRTIDGFGHGWPRNQGINEGIWAFLDRAPSRPFRNRLRRTSLTLNSCSQSRRARPTEPVGLAQCKYPPTLVGLSRRPASQDAGLKCLTGKGLGR
jgi:poly(3-hydroxybutyrate) depolymerase